MSEPFLAEIRIVGFNFAPRGWAFCDGQILPINQNQSLYSLLGTTYGGDGRTSFALPDLRSRAPMHRSDSHALAQKSGAETVTLTAAEIAAHTHTFKASSSPADEDQPANRVLAAVTPAGDLLYRDAQAASTTALRSGSVTNAGGGQAHNNMQPFTTLNFCIALRGLVPLAQLIIAEAAKEIYMSEPFVGEVRMFAGNFAPRGWAFCDGQLLAVSQNDALFSPPRHHLRRRRADHLRPARPARPHPASTPAPARGSRPRRLGAKAWRGERDPDGEPAGRATPTTVHGDHRPGPGRSESSRSNVVRPPRSTSDAYEPENPNTSLA